VGAESDPMRAAMERTARMSSSPGTVVLVASPDTAATSAVPLLYGRGLVDGGAAGYVCRGMVCDRPVTSEAALRDLLT
jgi:uncharacterized protein